jgi:hypothetical protein
MLFDRLAQNIGRFRLLLVAVELHRRLVLLPGVLPRRDLERLAPPCAGDEHRRPGLLRDRAAARRRPSVR